jgi:GTP pyrophosphokinase
MDHGENEYRIQSAIIYITDVLGQLYDEPKPTLFHCIRVGTTLYDLSYDIDVVLAGYLHDIIEDSDISYDDISEKYGSTVADIVLANTVDVTLEKFQRKADVITRAVSYGVDACVVMSTEILDGLQFYIRADDHEQLANKMEKAKVFLDAVPYEDPMIDELRKVCDKC